MSQSVKFCFFLGLSFLCHLIVLSFLPRFELACSPSTIWVNVVELPKPKSLKISGEFRLKGGVSEGSSAEEKVCLPQVQGLHLQGSFLKSPEVNLKLRIKIKQKRHHLSKISKTSAVKKKKRANTKVASKGVSLLGSKSKKEKGSSFGRREASSAVSELRPPKPLKITKPRYPIIARKMRYEGTVVLDIEVLPDGSVGEVKVVESSGYEVLDRAAVKEVKKWKFIPAVRNGKPVRSVVREKIVFKIR